MVQSLPRSRAQASRCPMSGLPRFSSQALAGSSTSTQVIERLIVPSCGIGAISLVVEQPATPKRREHSSPKSPRTRTPDTLACGHYGRRGAVEARDALSGLRLADYPWLVLRTAA